MTIVQIKVSGIVILMALSGACARTPEARRDKYLARGKSFVVKQDYARALLEFKNAARMTPKDPEVYYQIALASAGSGDFPAAVAGLRRVLALDPNHFGAQLKLAELMAGATDENVVKDAEKRLKEMLGNSPASADTLKVLAMAELRLGKTADAVQSLERALEAAPQELSSSMMLARVMLAQNDVKGAEDVLKKARDAAPQSADPHVALGVFYRYQNRVPEAEAELQRALKLNPKNGTALVHLASLQYAAGRKKEAEQTFKRASELPEKEFRAVHAQFLFADGRHDESIREFEALAKEDTDDRVARTRLIAAYLATRRLADAERVLDSAVQKNSKDANALIQRSTLYLDRGRIDLAEADLQAALRSNSASAEAHFYMAGVHAARAATLLQRQELTEAVRLDPQLLQARLALSRLLISMGAQKAALELIDQTPADQKKTLPVMVQRNWVLLAGGAWDELRHGVSSALALSRVPDLLVQQALLSIRDRKPAEARASLTEAIGMNPEDLRAVGLLARSYSPDDHAALEVVREHARKHPNSPQIQLFWAQSLVQAGDAKQASEVLSKITTANAAFTPASILQARMDAQLGRLEPARTRLRALVKENNSGTDVGLLLAKVEHAAGNWSDAIEGYKRVLASEPQNAEALNNLAYLLCDNMNKPDEALPYAEKAVELGRLDGAAEDTLGWIMYRKGRYTSAVKQFESALKKSPTPVKEYHLAMAYFQAGDAKRGDITLAQALRKNAELPEARAAVQLQAEVRKARERK